MFPANSQASASEDGINAKHDPGGLSVGGRKVSEGPQQRILKLLLHGAGAGATQP
jgi:hypothetical protein